MSTPAKKKATYDAMSPKIGEKRKARRKVAKEQTKSGEAPVPPKVDNYRVNNPRMARSLNIQPVIPERRKVAPTEGMPAVNSKSGEDLVKKAVTKVQPKKPKVDVKDAALPTTAGKDKGNGTKSKRRKTASKGTN